MATSLSSQASMRRVISKLSNEVVGEAAHVGGGRGAQALRVEEWWQGGAAATLRTLLLLLWAEMLSLYPPPLSLHLQTSFDLQELNLNLKWMLEITTGKHLIATKLNMHK